MKKKLIITSILLIALFIFQMPAFAASGSLSLSTDADITEGDSFDVIVSFSSKDEAIGSLQASIEYDKSAIEYLSGGGNAVEMSAGTGGISDIGNEDIYNFTYVLRFKALKSGTAAIKVKSYELVGFTSGDDLSSGSKELKINIDGVSGGTTTTNPSQNTDPIPVDIDGETAYILRDFGDKSVPSGFQDTQIPYKGESVKGAVSEALGLKLLCLMDSSGNTGLYIYFEENQSFFPFVKISDDKQYILTDYSQNPEGYEKTTIDFSQKTIPAWKSDDDDIPLVYAVDSEGKGAFFHFDLESGKLLDSPFTISVESSDVPQEEIDDPSPSDDSLEASAKYSPWSDNNMMIYLYALGALAVILIIAVVIAKVKKRHE